MKILFFSLNRLAFTGGAEKYILEVSRVFKQKGHEITYLGDCRPLLVPNVLAGFLTGLKSIRGIRQEFRDLRQAPSFPASALEFLTPRRLALSSFFPGTRNKKETLALLKNSDLIFVKNEILDMLSFWWLSLFLGNINAQLLAFSSFSYPSQTRRGRLHNLVYLSPFYAWLLKHFKGIIVSNRFDVEFLEKKFGVGREKIKLISYGLNPYEFRTSQPPGVILVSPPEAGASRIGFWSRSAPQNDDVGRTGRRGSGVFKILFVGRLEEQKGVDILFEVVRGLTLRVAATRRVEFTIIGDGPWRERVVDLVKRYPQVRYLGEISRKQVLDEYYRHDLLVVPSRWETFSYVTLEAQFCGLPVVAFDIPGPQDIIENGKTGQLVPLGDTAAFSKAVGGYIEQPLKAEENTYISKRAKETFSVSKTADSLLALLPTANLF